MQSVLIKTGKVPSGPPIFSCFLDYVPAESLPTTGSFPNWWEETSSGILLKALRSTKGVLCTWWHSSFLLECTGANREKRGTKMVLLYSKGALICLRANSSGDVVFSYVYVICFSFATGSDGAEQGEEQGQQTGCLSFFSFSSQTSVRPLADISPLQTPFFPFHSFCSAFNAHSPSDTSCFWAVIVGVHPMEKPSSPTILWDAVSQLKWFYDHMIVG